MLAGQFIPKGVSERHDIIFFGEKPSLYFVRHPKELHRGNYNVTKTDFIFQNYIYRYLKHAVFVTDMVKTQGKPGADFEKEWKNNLTFAKILLKELKKHKPKIVVAMSQKACDLFKDDSRFGRWGKRVRRIYHPSYVVRFRQYRAWREQFKELVQDLK